jgi:drug/metabolite transporter (DMT)-like permease
MAGGALRVLFSAVIFVASGLVQTICVQAVLYSGGGDRSTFLVALPNYLGILLVYLIGARAFRLLDSFGIWEARRRAQPDAAVNRVHLSLYVAPTLNEKRVAASRARPIGFFARLVHPERRKLFVLAFNELGGFLTGITGLSIAGSGLYQVVFSGGAVFTALLSVFFLRKRLAYSQWFFVAFITVGLMITAEQVTHSSSGDEAHATSIISGVAFVLVSCLFYSTNYVIAEHFLDGGEAGETTNSGGGGGGVVGDGSVIGNGEDSHSGVIVLPEGEILLQTSESGGEDQPVPLELPPPSGLDLSLYTGGSCFVIFFLYVMFHTVPHWNELVTLSIARHHGNYHLIAEQYLYLVIAAFLHAISHYDIVATVGAVPVGVLNAVRAVSVFGVSSLLFCEHQASQCYTARKGASTAIVIVGAVGYSLASSTIPGRARGALLPLDRRTKSARRSPDSVGSLERSMSAPFLGDTSLFAKTGASWFGFGRRKKEADV